MKMRISKKDVVTWGVALIGAACILGPVLMTVASLIAKPISLQSKQDGTFVFIQKGQIIGDGFTRSVAH